MPELGRFGILGRQVRPPYELVLWHIWELNMKLSHAIGTDELVCVYARALVREFVFFQTVYVLQKVISRQTSNSRRARFAQEMNVYLIILMLMILLQIRRNWKTTSIKIIYKNIIVSNKMLRSKTNKPDVER